MNKLKLLLSGILVLFLLQGNFLFGQERALFERINNQDFQKEWTVYHEDDLVSIYVKYSDCSDPANGIYPEYLLFKVENKTTQPVKVSWNWAFSYDGRVMSNGASEEEHVTLNLPGFASEEASCGGNDSKRLRLYVQDVHLNSNSVLTTFDFMNLSVVKL